MDLWELHRYSMVAVEIPNPGIFRVVFINLIHIRINVV